ncbi:MAG TPA: hypothetical protein VGM94_07400 [Galbitalea sp.]|jgi:hypothetical protein
MTVPPEFQQRPIENVPAGALLSLVAIPLGVILLVLLSSVGIVASLVGFAVAFAGLWLYRRGSGGIISRTGAWVVTAAVIVSLVLGLLASFFVQVIGGLGHLDRINDPAYTKYFGDNLPAILQQESLTIVLVIAFGALGSFRILGRAFRTTREQAGQPPQGPGATTPASTALPTYRNDLDGAPSGSADDKTPPPTSRY